MNVNKNKQVIIYYFTALISGFCIMGIETSATRILSPYFGSTTLIWLIEISLIMICIGIGNYFGGKRADKLVKTRTCEERIVKNLLISFLFICTVPLTSKIVIMGSIILASEVQLGNIIMISSIICSIVLFSVPLIFMGTISPLLAKISITSLDETGNVMGNLYLFNIFGSVLGTMIPTILIIPKIGVKRSFLLFGAVLAIILILYSKKIKKNFLLNSIICVLWLCMSLYLSTTSLAFDKPVHEEESEYNYINVSQNDDGKLALKTNVFFGAQSIKVDKNKKKSGYYYDEFVKINNLLDDKVKHKILIIGYGTGTMSTLLHKNFDNFEVTGIEIDRNIVNLRELYFNKSDDKIIISDGRNYLNSTDEMYDLIILDVYQNISMPINLTTREFFEDCKAHLNRNGIIALNIGLGNSLNSNLVLALSGTLKCVCPNVYKYKTKSDNNVIVYGSEKNLELSLKEQNKNHLKDETKKLFKDSQKVEDVNNILSDDINNIEKLQDEEFNKIVKNQMKIRKD